ncbi:uncharacterized protein B0T23DRAFT_401776 [Neurospora hispaniola]|uniref:Uncharacterized protein n=1 Tax=Neurospora hispaniola TaxID=588809 RepID=A0AAJ0MW17_9PEZI|nr:hypothetical protein B0T23DRAFT_401776 [Neurospora hispaniola]
MTKYTAEYMLAQVKDNVEITDPTLEALKLYPIPELETDLSNHVEWERALDFHLQYYGLEVLVRSMKTEYPHGPGRNDFKTTDHWHRWQRHCLHAYSIIYSQAAKVFKAGDLWSRWNMTSFCPHVLYHAISEHIYEECYY